MNIVTTTLNDLDHDKNGVVTAAKELNAMFEADGHPVWVMTPANGKSLADRMARRLNIYLRSFAKTTRFSIFFYASLKIAVWMLIKRISALPARPHVVIAHDALSADAAFRATGGNIVVLLVCHFGIAPWLEFANAGLLPEDTLGFRFLKRWMQTVMANPGVQLVAVSRKIVSLLHQITPGGSSNRIHLVYTGVSAPEFPERYPQPDVARPAVIVNVGRLDPWKNQRILPDVAAELVRRRCSCRFKLIGPNVGGEQNHIMDIARKLSVDGLFTLAGPMDREAVFSAMHEADMYLHTSIIESFGLTLVEAIAAGTPVMALAYDAITEVLPDTPEAIIPRHATAVQIADHVAHLLENPKLLADIQTRQRRAYERLFSAQAFRSSYLNLITRLIDGKH